MYHIQQASVTDAPTAARLAAQLWPSHSIAELEAELKSLLAQPDAAVFLAMAPEPVGFAQCQLRQDYVEGSTTSPVGYLEGIFVHPDFRHQGIARQLTAACEEWAASRGCREFASDCELDNTDSLAFHLRCGFAEAGRIICFIKPLK